MGANLTKNAVRPQVMNDHKASDSITSNLSSLLPQPKHECKSVTKHESFSEESLQITSARDVAVDFVRCLKRGSLHDMRLLYAGLSGAEDRLKLVNTRYMWQNTPLLYACLYRNIEAAIWLLECGAQKYAANEKGVTPLLVASLEGMTIVVERLLEWHMQDLSEVVSEETQPTSLDVQIGILYNAFVDRLVRLNPLCAACMNGHEKILRILIHNGADVNFGLRIFSQGKGQELCGLLLGLKYDHNDIVKVLLSHAADVSMCDEAGNNALMLACGSNNIDCADAILCTMQDSPEWCYIVKKCNEQGYTSLHLTVANEMYTVFERVIEFIVCNQLHAIMDIANISNRDTAMHMACKKNNLQIVKTLLKAGARATLMDNSGMTPFQYLPEGSKQEIVLWTENKRAT